MSFYKLALLLPFILPLCSAQSTYYVTPTPETPCPVESCLSFVEHTIQGGGHLENATLVFLSGTHIIESSIEIGNLTSLTLLGDSSSLPQVTSRISCSQPASINFQNIETLFISALSIVSCGSEGNHGAAVVVELVQNLTISNCFFQNDTNLNGFKGGALAVVFSSLAVSQTTFESNSASNGGGVYICNSVANFTGNRFENNHADYDAGGGVYIENSVANFTGNQFKNNQANYGGGVAIYTDSMVYFAENIFVNNDGGGAYIENGVVNFTGNEFKNNTARYGGGVAIYTDSVGYFAGNVFMNNVARFGGGGVDVYDNSTASFLNNILVKNTAADYGGAVFDEVKSSVEFSGNTFIDNSAMNGGGVAIQDNSIADFTDNTFINSSNVDTWEVEIDTTSTATFMNNGFINGTGYAIYGSTNNTPSINYVKPSPDTPCPESPCYTLSEYLRLADPYFTLNTTLVLLPGDHLLENKLLIRDILAFTMIGGTADDDSSRSILATATRIICSSRTVILHFQNISKVNINAVSFVSCGNANTSAHAMYLLALHYVRIFNCTFQNSIGGALSVAQTDTLLLTHSSFIDNFSSAFGGDIYVLTGGSGGAIDMYDSNATFTSNNFTGNLAGFSGGAIDMYDSNATFTSNSFTGNLAGFSGGAIDIDDSNATFTSNNFTGNLASDSGGAIVMSNCNATFTRNSFVGNRAESDDYSGAISMFDGGFGGAIDMYDSTATFTSNSFTGNLAVFSGGAIDIDDSIATFTSSNFTGNLAGGTGGAIDIHFSTVTLTSNSFKGNLAGGSGGAIGIGSSNTTFEGNTTFLRNSVKESGGAMFIEDSTVHFSGNAHFTTNSALLGGGAIFIVRSTMSYHGDTTFDNSTANSGGGIEAKDSDITFQQNTVFQTNSAVYGGAIYAISGNLSIREKSTFSTNSATYGGAVYAVQCYINFEGKNIIMKNNASRDGGGLLLACDSKYYLLPNATISFANNTAVRNGGAIKVDLSNQWIYCLETSLTPTLNECFFQLKSQTTIEYGRELNNFNVRMDFNDNTAGEGGSDIYGGAVDNCGLQSVQINDYFSEFQSSGSVLDYITSNSPETLGVSSDPLRICVCENNEAKCDSSSITRCAYPGGKFIVSVIAFGQRNGRVSAIIQTDLIQHTNIRFDSLQYIQNINNTCTDIEYTVFSLVEQTQEDIILHAQGPCPREGRSIEIKVEVLPCPRGFGFSSNKSMCVCSKRLEKLTDASCAIENGTILRPQGASFWVGYSNESGNGSDGLILHPHCPFDYCTSKLYVSPDSSNMQCSYNRSIEFYLPLNSGNILCSYNRTGKLCGECIQDLSLVLGSSRCLQCSDSHLALLAAFAFAGIALVFFLFLLKLTVAVGTINGLIFYANVVQVNSAVFFQPGTANILTVFIAWLNLDLGIETCFYDGMDAYAKTWLQFLFPIYVWTLVGIIILFSHFSQSVSRLLGTNPIAVLCTLFLLSYAKVLRTIIAALSFTTLEYPNGHNETVWLHDGNATYFTGKHVPLFLIALSTLLFVFLPFNLLLFCGQWLQYKSDVRVFAWINKRTIKSFLDAYHVPYVAKHRYWTGLLLLTRSSLFLIFAFNTLGNPDVNLFCIITATMAIITIGFAAEKIYENRYLGTLEASFIINLGIFAAATTSEFARGNQAALTYTSVSIAFVSFVGIVVYHCHLQLKDTRLLQKIANLTLQAFDTFRKRKKYNFNVEDLDKELTTSTPSMREPLLEDEI